MDSVTSTSKIRNLLQPKIGKGIPTQFELAKRVVHSNEVNLNNQDKVQEFQVLMTPAKIFKNDYQRCACAFEVD